MNWQPTRVLLSAAVLAAQLAGQERSGADGIMAGVSAPRPPVLEGAEPSDSVIVTLPGAPATAPLAPPAIAPSAAELKRPAPEDDDRRLFLHRAPKPLLPAEFERDSAAFCQKMIGLWTEPDAYNILGDPLHERAVADTANAESGRIYAFSDPTGRYRQIELDFARDTGLLRTVFVYPWKLSWQDCRRQWGVNVHTAQAKKGRIFYSYVNRRLDVLVDSDGSVISLGFY